MTDSILVTGGTGALGRALVDRLLAAGTDVRVLSRRPAPASGVPFGWCTGDLTRNAGVDAAVDGASVIVHCATTNGRADVPAAQHLFDAARRADTPHLLYISIVGADQVPLGYYRTKVEVEERLARSGLPYTLLRATQFHDLIVKLFTVQRRLPVLLAPRTMSVHPIDVRDVAEHLAALAAAPPAGRVPDIGGPQVRALTDLARAYLRIRGRKRPVLPVPIPGRVARAYRAGAHLTPDHAAGTITFEQFLGAAT